MKTTKNEIKEVIAEVTGLSVELDIEDKSRLKEDLGMDSMDRIELAMYLERKYYICIPDSILESSMETTEDCYKILTDLGIEIIN